MLWNNSLKYEALNLITNVYRGNFLLHTKPNHHYFNYVNMNVIKCSLKANIGALNITRVNWMHVKGLDESLDCVR